MNNDIEEHLELALSGVKGALTDLIECPGMESIYSRLCDISDELEDALHNVRNQ